MLCGCWTSACSGSAARTTPRRTRATASPRSKSSTCASRAARDRVRLHRQGRGSAHLSDRGPARGPNRYGAQAQAWQARRTSFSPTASRVASGGTSPRPTSTMAQGPARRGVHGQGLPDLERHGARGDAPRRPRADAEDRDEAVVDAIKVVAEILGNTPAVCRASYVDPRVISKFEQGKTIKSAVGSPGQGWRKQGLRRPRRHRESRDPADQLAESRGGAGRGDLDPRDLALGAEEPDRVGASSRGKRRSTRAGRATSSAGPRPASSTVPGRREVTLAPTGLPTLARTTAGRSADASTIA